MINTNDVRLSHIGQRKFIYLATGMERFKVKSALIIPTVWVQNACAVSYPCANVVKIFGIKTQVPAG